MVSFFLSSSRCYAIFLLEFHYSPPPQCDCIDGYGSDDCSCQLNATCPIGSNGQVCSGAWRGFTDNMTGCFPSLASPSGNGECTCGECVCNPAYETEDCSCLTSPCQVQGCCWETRVTVHSTSEGTDPSERLQQWDQQWRLRVRRMSLQRALCGV